MERKGRGTRDRECDAKKCAGAYGIVLRCVSSVGLDRASSTHLEPVVCHAEAEYHQVEYQKNEDESAQVSIL